MRYIVIGPEVSEVIPITTEGQGPLETWNDVFLVEANTKKEAAWAAFKKAKELGCLWYKDLDRHPLSGVKVTVDDNPIITPDSCPDDIGYESLEDYLKMWGEYYVEAS